MVVRRDLGRDSKIWRDGIDEMALKAQYMSCGKTRHGVSDNCICLIALFLLYRTRSSAFIALLLEGVVVQYCSWW